MSKVEFLGIVCNAIRKDIASIQNRNGDTRDLASRLQRVERSMQQAVSNKDSLVASNADAVGNDGKSDAKAHAAALKWEQKIKELTAKLAVAKTPREIDNLKQDISYYKRQIRLILGVKGSVMSMHGTSLRV